MTNLESGEAAGEAKPPAEYETPSASISAKLRAVSSVLSGSPLIGAGVLLIIDTDLATWASAIIIILGVAVVLCGLYFSFVGSRPRLVLLPNESALELRHPSLKPAVARMVMSLPFFAGAGYLLLQEQSHAVFYFGLSLVGMYLYFQGVIRYWMNRHTSYYVTDRRVVHMYRFAGLHTTEIPTKSINSISESRSFFELITGRGNIRASSGFKSSHMVQMQDIDDPGPMAQVIRGLIS